MLNKKIREIISASIEQGWVLEPEAKRLLSLAGLAVPRYKWTTDPKKAVDFARDIGYPVVAKVVSPEILHKSERGGVATGIDSDAKLYETYLGLSRFDGFAGVLVEEMLSGVELIVGAKVDYQFGPVILLGIGGTGVEIYRDTSLRMAPLEARHVASMVKGLKGHHLLQGYRGAEPVSVEELTRMMITFSELVMAIEELIESIDLNPVICSGNACVIADARIMLNAT
jgi:succinyl-CoA synthetase beta subunit